MRISNIHKLAARPRCLDLFEIENTKGAVTFKLRDADVFGRCINRGESIVWDAHVDPESVPSVSYSRFNPSLDQWRRRLIVIDAHDESIRAIGLSGVDQELGENCQAVAAAFRKGAVCVDDQHAKGVFVGERSD